MTGREASEAHLPDLPDLRAVKNGREHSRRDGCLRQPSERTVWTVSKFSQLPLNITICNVFPLRETSHRRQSRISFLELLEQSLDELRPAAALRGRDFVTPDDIKTISELALAHRIILKPEHQIKGLESGEVIQNILREVPVPTV